MLNVAEGQIVHSKAGRDKNRYFIVVKVINDDYVLIADGDLRKIENPKKKKIKHLVLHKEYADDILTRIKQNKTITDCDLKKCLQSMGLFEK